MSLNSTLKCSVLTASATIVILFLTPLPLQINAYHAPPPAPFYYYNLNDPSTGYRDYDHNGITCINYFLGTGIYPVTQALAECEAMEIRNYYASFGSSKTMPPGDPILTPPSTPPISSEGSSNDNNGAGDNSIGDDVYEDIIDESLGGYAGGLESDGEIHKWNENEGQNIYGDPTNP